MSGRKEFIVMGTSTVCGEEVCSKGKVRSREREGEGKGGKYGEKEGGRREREGEWEGGREGGR